jgi:spore coat polysaccharide biosynthesis predicted glycosyltransferase SpsG
MLKTEYIVSFVSKEIPDSIIGEILKSGFKLFRINSEADFFELITKDDIIILDGYNFDLNFQTIIKNLAYKLIYIDDFHTGNYIADLIINHAPGVNENDYSALPNTKYALGLKFALLRNSFLVQAQNKRVINSVSTVLICFGGADHINLTEKILKEVSELKQFKEIIVITGPSYRHKSSLQKVIESDVRILHFHEVAESEMLNLMLKSDLAIVPASGILLEALAAGCIVVSGYYINNQLAIYEGHKSLGTIIDAGDFRTTQIKEILNNLSISKQNQILDGLSGKRIIKIIKSFENVCADIG